MQKVNQSLKSWLESLAPSTVVHHDTLSLPESVHGNLLDVEIIAPLQDLRKFVKSLSMSLNLLDLVDLGEASIAVHDEGHMLGQGTASQDPQQKRLHPGVAVLLLRDPRHVEIPQNNN